MGRISKAIAAVISSTIATAATLGLELDPWVIVVATAVLAGLAVYAAPANTTPGE